MNWVNPPTESPRHIKHHTLFSELTREEIGYCIYLPPDYQQSGGRYPVAYHLHGYKGHKSSDIWALEKLCASRRAITVFACGVPGYDAQPLPVESMITTELIPHIDANYRTDATRESRALSGFSMGGIGRVKCGGRGICQGRNNYVRNVNAPFGEVYGHRANQFEVWVPIVSNHGRIEI